MATKYFVNYGIIAMATESTNLKFDKEQKL